MNKVVTIKGIVMTALLATGLVSVVSADSGDMSEAAILERIKPVGKLNTSGAPITVDASAPAAAPAAAEPAPVAEAPAAPAAEAPAAAPEPAAAPAATAARSGEEIYKATCFACHLAGVAGAPKLGDKAMWTPRIATGIDAMVTTVVTGKGAMPPRGTCANCSDDDLKAAVEYMVAQSQ